MRKVTALIIVLCFALCSLSACNAKTYEDGYNEGYNDGYSDAEFEVGYLAEEDFLDGYDIGFDEGYAEAYSIIDDATSYARKQTGWSVYEAWNNIAIYNEGLDPYGYPLPTEEEYLQSIETLVLFCEYLENAGLGG